MPQRRRSPGRACLWLLAAAMLAGRTDAAPPPRWDFQQPHMGVDVRISLYGPSESAANDAAIKAFARIGQLNDIFSDYDSGSEIMRLCRAAAGKPHPVSPDLFHVLETAEALARRSDGAFDVTVGPLSKLWRRARRRYQLPDPANLAEARTLVGWKLVTLDPMAHTVTLARSDMHLDFGGLVKGYAAEEALKVLRGCGFPQSQVAIAGDIAAGDPPPGQPGWRVGIAPLDRPDGDPSTWVCLVNASISTSGDAFQSVEIDGVRYSHIVDPRTGVGLTHRGSVTVIAPRGILADGVATAASVLPPDAGRRFIEQTPGAAGLMVVEVEGTLEVHRTPRFDAWLWREPAD